jgi:hypothetical protein
MMPATVDRTAAAAGRLTRPGVSQTAGRLPVIERDSDNREEPHPGVGLAGGIK